MKISSSLIAALLLAGGLAYQFKENRALETALQQEQRSVAALRDELASMESNLDSMRAQLMNMANSLQEARQQLNGDAPLATRNDLGARLHGKQPPGSGSSTAIRPPAASQDIGSQMARMQADVRYGEFVENLAASASEKSAISEVIADVFVERIQVSKARATGTAGAADLERIGSTAYLRERLVEVLNAEQLLAYDSYEAGFQELQLRNTFTLDISRYAPALTETSHKLVLDALMRHLGTNLLADMNSNANAVTETRRQLMALEAARQEILAQLNEAQGFEAEKLLTRIRSAMVQSQSMNEGLDNQ